VAGRQFDPLDHGIGRSLVDNTGMYLNTAAWNRAAGGTEFVGTCRVCGDHMVAEPTVTTGRTDWYVARCINAECHHEVASPDGRILRRSTRRDEMPQGFWEKRTGAS
jgi:hypothetical protein